MRSAIKFIALLAFIAVPSFATAGTVCPTDIGNDPPIWDNVTPNTGVNGCELGSTNNDSETQVNLDAMFDITDWELLTGADANFQVGTLCADPDSDPDCDNGTGWVYPSDAESIMLVLKGGAGDNTEPPVYVGYLLDGLPSVIEILASPFLNVQGDTGQNISHFNLYWSADGDNTVTEVPEPATMLLVGGGLLAAVRRRRAKK